MLSEVATSHKISSLKNSGATRIKIENDIFDKYGAVLDVNSKTVSESDLKRVKESIGVRNIKVDKVFELDISGNKKSEKR
jgi:phosphoribosylformylglycinamidine (FGAM) synthase PurS component